MSQIGDSSDNMQRQQRLGCGYLRLLQRQAATRYGVRVRFFFDARYIRTDFHDGISRYSAELARALHQSHPDEVTFLIHDRAQLEHLPTTAKWLLFHSNESPLEPIAALKLNKYKPDVVFSPLQTIGTAGRKYLAINTLHDLIYHRHPKPPGHLNPLLRLGWRAYHLTYIPQRLTLNGADLIATVSETTKQQIREHKLTRNDVVVVPNAPNELATFLDADARPGSQAPANIVYMGAFLPYKNVETLIRGMAHLPGRTLHLCSRIQPARKRELEALVPEGANVVFHEGVSDAKYAQLLADRAVLATASLDEGYGLPVAESLALGVPAVISDMPIFHEVAGDGAKYFNPHDPAAFAAAVLALDNDDERSRVRDAGLRHIAQFSWQRSAATLWDAAQQLLRTCGR